MFLGPSFESLFPGPRLLTPNLYYPSNLIPGITVDPPRTPS